MNIDFMLKKTEEPGLQSDEKIVHPEFYIP